MAGKGIGHMHGKGKAIDNEKKTQETVWSNMGHLMRILLLQFRSAYYGIIILTILVPFWNLLQIYLEVSGHPTPWSIQISCGGYLELLVAEGILLGGIFNILSRNEISMYPGTVISRYGATVMAFHIMILLFTLASVVSYLLQGFLLWAGSCLWEDCILGNSFSLSYLWYGSFRYLGLLLAVFSLGIFYFVLMERFHAVRVYLCTFALFVILAILARGGYLTGIMQSVRNLFLGNGYSYGTLMAVLFGTWAIMMLFSSCLAGMVKVWGEADKTRLIVVFALVYLVGMASAFTILFREGFSFSYEMDPIVFQRESSQQKEVIVDTSNWEEQDKTLLSYYNMSIKYGKSPERSSTFESDVFASVSCSASEAKRYGLSFDESKLDQDHVILLLGTRNLTFAGKDLGKDALQAYQQSMKLVKDPMDEEYQEENPEEEYQPDYYYQTEMTNDPVIVINCFYGNLGVYMDDTTINSEGDIWGNRMDSIDVTNSLLRIVIYPD